VANLRGRAGFPACSFATRQGCPFDETGTMPVLRSHAAKRVEDWGAYASRRVGRCVLATTNFYGKFATAGRIRQYPPPSPTLRQAKETGALPSNVKTAGRMPAGPTAKMGCATISRDHALPGHNASSVTPNSIDHTLIIEIRQSSVHQVRIKFQHGRPKNAPARP
jgi:hypothetical protein